MDLHSVCFTLLVCVDFSGLGGIWDGPSHSGNGNCSQTNQYNRTFCSRPKKIKEPSRLLSAISPKARLCHGMESGLSFGQNLVLPDRLNGAVGGSITFTPISAPPPPYRSISWASEKQTIVTVVESSVFIIDQYRNRTSYDINTLSMELRNLTESDAGTYTLSVESARAETSLQVFVKISGVTLTGSADVVTEGNPFNLICEGRGDITYIEWKKDDHPLSAGDGITFSPDKKTLMINPVKRKDRGEYQCTISNPISSGTAKYRISFNGDGGGLSAGAIAGIVVGGLLVVVGIAGLIFYFLKTKGLPKSSSSGDQQKTVPNGNEQDSGYENIRFQTNNIGVNVGGSNTRPPSPDDPDHTYETCGTNVTYENVTPVKRK